METETKQKRAAPIEETPPWLSEKCYARLRELFGNRAASPATVIDPQCGSGSLLRAAGGGWATKKFGIDTDGRPTVGVPVIKQTESCVRVWDVMDDIADGCMFTVGVACPPVVMWKMPDGGKEHAAQATWDWLTKHASCGYVIAPTKVAEDGAWDQDPVFRGASDPFKASDAYMGASETLQLGVYYFGVDGDQCKFTDPYKLMSALSSAAEIVDEERKGAAKFNIDINPYGGGELVCGVTKRQEAKRVVDNALKYKLSKANGHNALSLTTEKEDRNLLRELLESNATISPAAKEAIEDALKQAEELSCPIMPVSDYEAVAYADEDDSLKCIKGISDGSLQLEAGKTYSCRSLSYSFQDKFTQERPHFNEETGETYTVTHECTLSGKDRMLQVHTDGGYINFKERPNGHLDRDESMLWEHFEKPKIKTLEERHPDKVKSNISVLKACEMIGNYKYMPGQLDYLARIACKDSGIVAAETGTGKTLMAISLISMKGPKRALIVAPQGTMRSTKRWEDEDGESEMAAAQWVQELNRFAPYLRVYELFSMEDAEKLKKKNGGTLPAGVFISYYEAMFQNKARESAPSSWTDEKLNQWAAENGFGPVPDPPEYRNQDKKYWVSSIGREENGIRCILHPCMSTQIGSEFDMVILDEAHKISNLSANVTQMAIRLQPKYRWGLTATPITNVITNLFSLMGWVAVDDWYKGNRRSAGWPYARGEIAKFADTFMSKERDHTAEAQRRKKDWGWRGKCEKNSAIISSPARLLKLLKPWMAYISKEQCNPKYKPAKVVDIRVPLGKDQAALYGHFTDRGRVPGDARSRARLQPQVLRNVCCDPAGFSMKDGKLPQVTSNMNPKVISVLELVAKCLKEKEQCLIINSRVGLTDEICRRLRDAGVKMARIDSTIPAKRHAEQAQKFREGKADVMLMGIKCAAAYSFSHCKYEIISSIEYSPGPFNQAKGRIDRVDSDRDREIYCILHENTIEEVMFDYTATKDDAATICLKGKRVPRDYKPVSSDEILVEALKRFDLSGATPEATCEDSWPKLKREIVDIK